MSDTNGNKVYRMLRVLEYVGTREWLDAAIAQRGVKGSSPTGWSRGGGTIYEAIVQELPERLTEPPQRLQPHETYLREMRATNRPAETVRDVLQSPEIKLIFDQMRRVWEPAT